MQPQTTPIITELQPQTIITNDEKFYCRSLEALRDNEMNIKQYWSKPVQVTVIISPGEISFRGQFSCCDDSGWVSFNDVFFDKHPEAQFLTGMYFPMYHISCIIDIILIDEIDSKKSITNAVFDVLRLKLVRKVLFKMTSTHSHIYYSDLAPFDVTYRKLYFKSSTKASVKQHISDNILKIKIPQNLIANPLFTSLFTSAVSDTDNIKTGHRNYSLNAALSILHDYHALWIQYIKQNNSVIDSDEKETAPTPYKFNKSYVDWDNYELNVAPPHRYSNNVFLWNSVDVFERPAYSNAMRHVPVAQILNVRAKIQNVYIESIWPYYFVGPVTKSKKKHPDWLCMKCLKESTVTQYLIEHMYCSCEESKENIYFYKSNRTDMTMEICQLCVESCLAAQRSVRFVQKQTKASKRYYKRLKKKLDEYNEKEIPWTPPTILAGIGYSGISRPRPAIGYVLPYPRLLTYMPGMNPPLAMPSYIRPKQGPVRTKPGFMPNFSLPYSTLPSYMPGVNPPLAMPSYTGTMPGGIAPM